MKFLITGGCGFLGSNLAAEVLKRGEELIIFDNLYRVGSCKNLEWLKEKGDFRFFYGDIRNREDVEKVISVEKPEIIFHSAAQVAMTTSLENPRLDFEVNALGTFNLLEAVRKYSHSSVVLYSSTNKVYGDLEWLKYEESETRYIALDFPNGFDESLKLDFHSPYGCSKGIADQYMLDYARMFGLRTVVFRHSSIYGERQFATYDQGWVGWFCMEAIKAKRGLLEETFTISGDGKQVRDILYIDDAVELYFKAVENIEIIKGDVFNIGGGSENSLSLLELFNFLEKELNIRLNYKKLPSRKSDQRVFIANTEKAKEMINWSPRICKFEGVRYMLNWAERI